LTATSICDVIRSGVLPTGSAPIGLAFSFVASASSHQSSAIE
jgi:hypothetical protein